jgi:hypothetical protein
LERSRLTDLVLESFFRNPRLKFIYSEHLQDAYAIVTEQQDIIRNFAAIKEFISLKNQIIPQASKQAK